MPSLFMHLIPTLEIANEISIRLKTLHFQLRMFIWKYKATAYSTSGEYESWFLHSLSYMNFPFHKEKLAISNYDILRDFLSQSLKQPLFECF